VQKSGSRNAPFDLKRAFRSFNAFDWKEVALEIEKNERKKQ
jgi:hypothetical protein